MEADRTVVCIYGINCRKCEQLCVGVWYILRVRYRGTARCHAGEYSRNAGGMIEEKEKRDILVGTKAKSGRRRGSGDTELKRKHEIKRRQKGKEN